MSPSAIKSMPVWKWALNSLAMKRNVLVILFCCMQGFLSSIFAQSEAGSSEYYPVGTTWQETYLRVYEQKTYDWHNLNTVVGDTIIDNKKYKWVTTERYGATDNSADNGTAVSRYLIREKGDSIFGRDKNGDEKLRYVFGTWHIGDPIYCFQDTIARLSAVTLLDGKEYVCVDSFPSYQSTDELYRPQKVIHSIGSVTSGLLKEVSVPRGGFVYILLSFTRNGVTLYRDDRYETTEIKSLETYPEQKSTTIYSLDGVPMNEGYRLPKGIYIKDRKKVVIK